MPDGIVYEFIRNLDLNDLARLTRTNRLFQSLIDEEMIREKVKHLKDSEVRIAWESAFENRFTRILKIMVRDARFLNKTLNPEIVVSISDSCDRGYLPLIEAAFLANNPSSDLLQICLDSAIRRNQTKVVRFLVENTKVDVKFDEYLPFTIALTEGYLDILKILATKLEPGVHDRLNILVANTATAKDNLEIIKFFISTPFVQVNYSENLILTTSANRGQIKIMKYLIEECGLDPSIPSTSPVLVAIQRNHTEIVEYLLADKRINPADEKHRAFLEAIKVVNTRVLRLLLADSRINPVIYLPQAITTAVNAGHIDTIVLLLQDHRIGCVDTFDLALETSLKRRDTSLIHQLLLRISFPISPEMAQNILNVTSEDGHLSLTETLLSLPERVLRGDDLQ